MPDELVRVFLAGDVMTGRGVDQILPHPGDSRLWEMSVKDSRTYVRLAEELNGPIPRPVDVRWIWGDALPVLDDLHPDVRIVNLETSVTRSADVAAGKRVHYRMSPENVGCLTTARLDVVALANNHVLDFGRRGLEETLESLAAAGLRSVGAGRNEGEAARAVVVRIADDRRVGVFSCGLTSSGIPRPWAATDECAGVDLLPDLSAATAARIADRVTRMKRPGDVVVVSIHWGDNWGYHVPADQIDFAHRLVDDGVDVVHGHSSHHPRPIEIYRGKLILYGCGDLIDDYEGITGYERYRDDLRLLYFASIDPSGGRLIELRMAPMQARMMRLRHATPDDTDYLHGVLARISRPFGVRVEPAPEGMLRASGA